MRGFGRRISVPNPFVMLIIFSNKPQVILVGLGSVAITIPTDVVKGLFIIRKGMTSRWALDKTHFPVLRRWRDMMPFCCPLSRRRL